MQVDHQDFEAILDIQIGDWLKLNLDIRIIVSGMITSNLGWVETPYLSCPTDLHDISDNLVIHHIGKNRKIYFVPGISQLTPSANIMRGEETEMFGLHSKDPLIAVLPGTHSKWIWMENEIISKFSTFMTGELFAALTKHTILGRLIREGYNIVSFDEGVQEGFTRNTRNGGILSKLFTARAKPVLNKMDTDSIKDYISGLLLGTEIQEALGSGFQSETKIIICGSNHLVKRYERALNNCGLNPEIIDKDTAASGLLRIALEANI